MATKLQQMEDIQTSDFLNQVIEDTGITRSDASPESDQAESFLTSEQIGKENISVKAVKGKRQCPFCHAKFAIHLDLQKHMDLYHNEDRAHACGECGKRYRTSRELQTHINTAHKNIKAHECSICSKRFTTKNSLIRHSLIHSGEKNHECHICNRRFRMSYSLKDHMHIHTGARPYECDICGKTWTNRTDLRIHLRQHAGVREHICDTCGKEFLCAKRLKVHRKIHEKALMKEKEVPMHNCPFCKHVFMKQANLNQHIRHHHSKANRKEVVAVGHPTAYYCTHCKTHYSSFDDLTRHVVDEHSNHECTRCKKQFTDTDLLRQHVREHHPAEEGVPCHLCTRDFPNDDVLALHLSAHAQHPCPHCASTFTNSNALKEHALKLHNPEKMEVCKVCSQKFVNKQRLLRHLHCHAHPAPLKCRVCKAGFNHEKTLTIHLEQVHNVTRQPKITDQKPKPMENFQLDYNGSTMNVVFADPITGREDLKTMVIGEEVDFYQCKVCMTEFTDREELDLHLNDHDSAEIVLSIISKQRQDDDALPKDIIVTRASEDTQDQNLECEICEVEFASEAVYNAHVLKHKSADDVNVEPVAEAEQEELETEPNESEEGDYPVRTVPYELTKPKQKPKLKSTHCPYCEGNLPTVEDQEMHINIHEEEGDFKCFQCNEEFVYGEDLLKHKEVHKRRRNRTYQCAHCRVILEDLSTMKVHMETHNEGLDLLKPMDGNDRHLQCSSDSSNRHECPTCMFFFDSKDKLRRHMSVHRDQKPHECTTCGRGFTKITTLKYHEKSHKPVAPYGCSVCSDQFDQPHKLASHMDSHGKARFSCLTCDARFHTKSDLSRHVLTHKPRPALSCAICDSVFLSTTSLREHAKTHANPHAKKFLGQKKDNLERVEEMFKDSSAKQDQDQEDASRGERCYWCIICSASFTKEEDLKEHGRSHFKCDHCATEYQDALEVENHMLDHYALERNICLTCGENFEESSELLAHILQTHPNSRTCFCEKCKTICLNARHLKIHLMSHPLEQEADIHCDFYCEVCRLLFTTESFLNIHNERHKPCGICTEVAEDLTLHLLQNHSLPQVEKCYHCDRVLTDPDTRADHLNMHVLHPEVLERCTDCENGFGDIDNLIEHMKVGHSCDAAKCIICGMLCLGNDDLNEHLRQEHMVFDLQRCSQCSCIFMNATFDDMLKHAAEHEAKVELNCCTCDAKFESELLLQQHLQTHESLDNLYKCVECEDSKFPSTKVFRNHMRQGHGVIGNIEKCRVCCGICNKILNLESIGTHVKLHLVGTKQFPCNICPLSFATKNSLERHVLIHTDERPAICETCGRGFRNVDRLRTHARRHTKQYQHKCQIDGCNKKFFAKSKLRDHQTKKHGLDAPFGCILCNAKFVYRRQLRVHMKKHTGTLQFGCQSCDAVFTDEEAYRRHISYHHHETPAKKDNYPKMCDSCSMPLYSSGMEAKHVCPTEHVPFSEVYDHGKGAGDMPTQTPLITGPTARDAGKVIMEPFQEEMETDAAMDDAGDMGLADQGNDYIYVAMDEAGMENYCSICMIQFSSPAEVASHMLLHQDNPPIGE